MRYLSILAVVFMMGCHNIRALAQKPSSPFSPEAIAERWKWTKVKWNTEGDAALRARRHQIDAMYNDGASHAAVVKSYRDQWLQVPEDRGKLFSYGYACYCETAANAPVKTINFEVLEALQNAKPPYSYEFMKMRFLILNAQGMQRDELNALGERLLAADPKDKMVLAYLSRAFPIHIPETRKKALGYSEELIKLFPDNPNGYSSMANVYYNDWILSNAKDANAAQQAVYWIKEYLKRENKPAREHYKEDARKIMERLEKWLANGPKV